MLQELTVWILTPQVRVVVMPVIATVLNGLATVPIASPPDVVFTDPADALIVKLCGAELVMVKKVTLPPFVVRFKSPFNATLLL